MPSIKIYPPAQLPDRNLSDTQFNIWREELEVYLSQEKDFKIFLPGQPYAEWESAESYNDRIRHLNENDINAVERGRNERQLEEDREEKLANMHVLKACIRESMLPGALVKFRPMLPFDPGALKLKL